jgi:hypothetical protein
MVSDLFVKNRECIREFAKDQSLASSSFERLTIASEGAITTVFAPFDHTSVSARIAVVGITPGLVQAENALRAAGAALRDGKSDAEASRLAKLTASFSGTQTRNNLVNMLNAVGLASAFGVQSCEEMPLGPKPALALHHLVKIGALPASRLLDGMPHPSGLNGERVAAFLGKIGLGEASVKTRPENLAAARETIRARVTEAFV